MCICVSDRYRPEGSSSGVDCDIEHVERSADGLKLHRRVSQWVTIALDGRLGRVGGAEMEFFGAPMQDVAAFGEATTDEGGEVPGGGSFSGFSQYEPVEKTVIGSSVGCESPFGAVEAEIEDEHMSTTKDTPVGFEFKQRVSVVSPGMDEGA